MRLTVADLAAERGGETIFSGVSFTLGAGNALVITGPNGAGKSTLLRTLAGLLPATAGSIEFDGGSETWPTLAAALHYLGPQNAMKPALTVGENLEFWRVFNGSPRLSVAQALESVRLPDVGHLPYGYLSTGQRRRISIARLLVSHRPVWLLDEPTSGLDMASERRFAELMKDHLAEAGIVVAATHLPLGLGSTHSLVLDGRGTVTPAAVTETQA